MVEYTALVNFYSPCYSPCAASLAAIPPRGLGLSGQVHEEANPSISYKRLYLKSGLLHIVFWSFVIFNCDDCMRTVFIPLHKAISNLLCQFYDYVFGNA